MSSYHDLINKYRNSFEEKDIPIETLKVLLFELCNERDINLYLELDNQADKEIKEIFELGVKRLEKHEPLAHVLGYSYFYGYKFYVNGDVLIPRYETEELVMNILMHLDNQFGLNEELSAADVGTGSGAIAISLMKEYSKLNMIATDISEAALKVATKNAKYNEVDIEFVCGDMLKPLIKKGAKLDLLVSNPPYIPQKETLETSVKDYEPHVALFGGEDGLEYYRVILNSCSKILKDKALIAFEIGFDQRQRLEELIYSLLPNSNCTCYQDINGKDRMIIIEYNK